MKKATLWVSLALFNVLGTAGSQTYNFFPPPGYNCSVGPPAQIPFANTANKLLCTTLLSWNNSTDVLNIGAATTPGTFSVGQLDSMVVNGVAVPIPGFALNSNIQGVIENHSYVAAGPTGGSRYYGVRSRGTISAPAIVANGDNLNTIYAAGFNGTNYSLGGQLQFKVDGTPGASAMPTDACISVSPAGSQTPTERFCTLTDGSYRVSGSVGTAGQVLTSGGAGAAASWTSVGGGPVMKVKTADTSRNTTTVLADDPDLVFTGLAAGVHTAQCFLQVTTAATPGFKLQVNTTGALAASPGGTQVTATDQAGNPIRESVLMNAAFSWPIANARNTGIVAIGFNTTNSGTLSIQWAQTTSNATNTTVQAGSWCELLS